MSVFDKIAAYGLTVLMAFSLGYNISQDNSSAKEVASQDRMKCYEVQVDKCWTRIDRLEQDLNSFKELFIKTTRPLTIEDIVTTNRFSNWIFEETRDPLDNMPCFGWRLKP